MEKRIKIDQIAPQEYKAMLGLEGFLTKAKLKKSHKELIKIRASQINNCAYCIDMHTKDALKNGETANRIFLISAWREAIGIFTEEEQLILEMTEEITQISQHGLSEKTYEKASRFFSDNLLAEIIVAVVIINSWNRIAVSTRLLIGE